MMDSIFLLGEEGRRRFFRSAGGVLRCSYICLWSPLPQSPSPNICFFISNGGWHHEDDGGGGGPSSAASSSKQLFDAYRSSLCSIQDCSCVPGLAYKCHLPYVELSDSDLMDLASIKVQRQFYQEAGIKTAIFLRCTRGEVEFGMTAPTNYASIHSIVQRIFSEEFVLQRSQLPSSLPHHVLAMRSYSPHRNHLLLPSPARDEAAVAQAMLAVISSSTSPPPPSAAAALLTASSSSSSKRDHRDLSFLGAFRPYDRAVNSAAANRSGASNNVGVGLIDGQKMIKMMVKLLRRMSRRQPATSSEGGWAAATSVKQYSDHVISERKRREKLNESFHALRMLLPQEYNSKKDKVSVLFNARDYLKALRAEVSELEERNRLLETELKLQQPRDENYGEKNTGDSKERVQVLIGRAPESTSETQEIRIAIAVREEHCDAVDVLLGVLESLRQRGNGVTLVSAEGSSSALAPPQANGCMKASITLQVKTSECDEESFKAAVMEAVNDVLARSATPTA